MASPYSSFNWHVTFNIFRILETVFLFTRVNWQCTSHEYDTEQLLCVSNLSQAKGAEVGFLPGTFRVVWNGK